MELASINRKLAWAVLIAGLSLTVMSGIFAVMTSEPTVLLVALLGAVAAQAGKITLRDNPDVETANDRLKELVTA